MSTTAAIARRYAQALLDIGIEQDIFEQFNEQLVALADLFRDSREFQITMLNPSIKLKERKAIMRKIAEQFGLHDIVRNFTLLLLDNERFRHIVEISEEYQRVADRRAGRIRAEVTSAVAMGDAQTEKLKAQLLQLTGANEIELTASVDADLIGGVVAKVGSIVLDGSVRHQFESMRSSILQESS